MRKLVLAAASMAALLTGCATSPDPTQTPLAVRTAFENAGAADAAQAPDAAWWQAFEDPLLDNLIAQAMGANRDLRAAEADLKQARANARLARAAGGPVGALDLGAGREKDPQFGSDGSFATTNLQASWELDVFGRIRASTAVAEADALTYEAARRGVMTVLAAEISSTYADLRGAQGRLAAAKANVEAQRETHRLTETLREGGRATQLEVMRAETSLQGLVATLPRIEAQIETDIANLDLLTAGLSPQAKAALRAPGAVSAPPARLTIGSPDDLLRRRPDLQQAQARVEAAVSRVRVARVDWWPRISLVASAGLYGEDAGSWSNDDAFSYSIGPRIDWPALDVRRNALRLEAAQAGAEAQFARYDQAVLTAVRDVEAALTRFDAARRSEAASNVAAQSARRAAEVSRLRYREGVDAFFNVLDAQRTLALADDNLAVARSELALAYVGVGQALGVGWSETPQAVTASASR